MMPLKRLGMSFKIFSALDLRNLSPQGSGMRPTTTNPSPTAPPIVQSNDHYSGPAVQMPQPFGSGIGFRPNITNSYYAQGPPMGYQNPQMQRPPAPYPSYPQTIPPPAQFQDYSQNFQPHLPHTNFPVNSMAHQTTAHQQVYQTCHYPTNIYPNLNQPAPISYTPHNPNIHRSTSDYMRKVIVGRFRQLAT